MAVRTGSCFRGPPTCGGSARNAAELLAIDKDEIMKSRFNAIKHGILSMIMPYFLLVSCGAEAPQYVKELSAPVTTSVTAPDASFIVIVEKSRQSEFFLTLQTFASANRLNFDLFEPAATAPTDHRKTFFEAVLYNREVTISLDNFEDEGEFSTAFFQTNQRQDTEMYINSFELIVGKEFKILPRL